MKMRNMMDFAEKRPGMNIGIRGILAVFGAYGFGVLGARAFAGGLSPPLDAAALSVMLAFILEAGAIIWVFAASTVARAAMGLAAPAALFGAWLAVAG